MGIGLFLKETVGRVGQSRIVHGYHNLSVPRIVGKGIQAIPVSHVNISDANAGGIIEAWKDSGLLNGKGGGNARCYISKYGQWFQHDS